MVFDAAKSSLRSEMINDPDFVLLSVDDTAFYSGIALMEAYNINATDAALLFLFQSYITTVPQTNQAKFIIVAADERLIHASEAEGLTAINPESLFAADIPALLANL